MVLFNLEAYLKVIECLSKFLIHALISIKLIIQAIFDKLGFKCKVDGKICNRLLSYANFY